MSWISKHLERAGAWVYGQLGEELTNFFIGLLVCYVGFTTLVSFVWLLSKVL